MSNEPGPTRATVSIDGSTLEPTLLTSTASGPNAPARPPAADILPGLQLGPVRLLEQVGAGAMGVVFRAHHTLLGCDVAVKFLAPSDPAAGPSTASDLFLQEIRAAAAVRHPHLVQIHHADLYNNAPYLVMDYIRGVTLKQALARGRLELPLALAILDDIAAAVDALHDSGIIHRDLKPSNILINTEGQSLVGDFGLALRGASAASLSGRATPAGTLAYMAPEVFDGHVSARSDVYSLGLIFYELLVGAPPFKGGLEELRAAHANQPLPTEPLSGLPPAIIEILERCTHKKPIFRYKSAGDFLRALEAHQPPITPEHRRRAQVRALLDVSPAGCTTSTGSSAQATDQPGSSSYPTYFDMLSRISRQKREQRLMGAGSSSAAASSSFPHPASKPDAPSPPAAPPPPIEADVPCQSCGRNLKGLSPTTLCPGCAGELSESILIYNAIHNPGFLSRAKMSLVLLCLATFFAWFPAGPVQHTVTASGSTEYTMHLFPWSAPAALVWWSTGSQPLLCFIAALFPTFLALSALYAPAIPWNINVNPWVLIGSRLAAITGLLLAAFTMILAPIGYTGAAVLTALLLLGLVPLTAMSFSGLRTICHTLNWPGLALATRIIGWILSVSALVMMLLACLWTTAAIHLPGHGFSPFAFRITDTLLAEPAYQVILRLEPRRLWFLPMTWAIVAPVLSLICFIVVVVIVRRVIVALRSPVNGDATAR